MYTRRGILGCLLGFWPLGQTPAGAIIFTKLPALCDGCLGWGWVWWAGLVAGLWLEQAFGVLLLPGFGVSSSSPQVPGHPTSICDAGVNH